MDFSLTDVQRDLQKTMDKFVRAEIAPLAEELDRESRFLPIEKWLLIGEMGYLSLPFPEEYGGSDLGALDTLICMESAAAAGMDGGTLLSWGAHMILAGIPIVKYGTGEQKSKYLPPMATGEMIGALALTEPNAGSDAGRLETTAVKKGDHYILNGTKMFITNGPICDLAVVFAVTDKSKGSRGISAFIVEKSLPGFSAGKKLHKMGVRSSPTSEIIFEDCPVPAENLLGAEGDGFKKVGQTVLDWERMVFGYFTGMMQYNLQLSLDYARSRVQFGRPIVEFQAIQHKLAEMKMNIDAARLLAYRTAWMIDQGLSCSLEASVAKLFLGDSLVKNTSEAVQIYGGYGYMSEYPVERSYRDAKITQIGGGTSEIQKSKIARLMLANS